MKSSSNGFCFFCRNSIPFLTPTGVDYFLVYWLYYLAEGNHKLTPFRLGDKRLEFHSFLEMVLTPMVRLIQMQWSRGIKDSHVSFKLLKSSGASQLLVPNDKRHFYIYLLFTKAMTLECGGHMSETTKFVH